MNLDSLLALSLLRQSLGLHQTLLTVTSVLKKRMPTVKFEEFLDENWETTLEKSPYFASLLGDKRYDDKVSSNSVADFYDNRDYEEYV